MNKNHPVAITAGALAVVGVFMFAYFISLNNTPSGNEKIEVVASFYPLYFFAKQIGGDKARVTNITPAGAEPHDYEPTAQDLARIENSDILILNGEGLEAWGEKMKHSVNADRTIIIAAGEGLAAQPVVGGGEIVADPHVWLSPKLAGRMVDRIVRGFIQADETEAAYYTANGNILKSELEALDNEYAAGLNNCADRNIITSHAAFGHLVSAYGLNQIAIAGLSPDAEPSPRRLAEIVEFAEKNGAKFIFFESLVNPKLSKTIAAEIGAGTMTLNPLEGLGEDELAEGKTYFTEMRSNLINLKTALQCGQ